MRRKNDWATSANPIGRKRQLVLKDWTFHSRRRVMTWIGVAIFEILGT
jgi:hypothetical protein